MKTLLTLVLAVALAGALAAMLFAGFKNRKQDRRDLENNAQTSSILAVSVGHPQGSAPGSDAVFPANVLALVETPIYARTNGYLKKWYTDMGTHVEAGQLLAEIETPEVDQQLKQAQATVTSLQAAVDLDRTTAKRFQELLKKDGVSQQEVDAALGALRNDEGKLAGAQADVERWKEMQGFKQVRAPYAGNIYQRNVDTGALISAGNSTVLFRLSDTSILRIHASVSEEFSHSIKLGMPGQVECPSNPGRRFTAKVERTSGSLDSSTRTLLTELQMPNPDHRLVPGEFCQVRFPLKSAESSLVLPASALLFRAQGSQVALVDEAGKVHMRDVKLGRDFGRSVEILGGLSQNDTIILNPSDSISDGTVVKPVFAEKAAAPAQQ